MCLFVCVCVSVCVCDNVCLLSVSLVCDTKPCLHLALHLLHTHVQRVQLKLKKQRKKTLNVKLSFSAIIVGK